MFNSIVSFINDLTNSNQFLSGAVGLWGLGVVTYFFKVVPSKVYKFLKKHLTTELIITSNSPYYNYLMEYLQKNKIVDNIRTIKVKTLHQYYYQNSSDYEKNIKGIGYGNHLIFINKIPLLIEIVKDSANQTANEKDSVIITKFGRSHSLFDKLLNDCYQGNDENLKNNNRLEVYKLKGDNSRQFFTSKRDFNTLFLTTEVENKIIKSLDNFLSNEEYYLKNGIPYQFGIVLYGEPGTGKTSVIRAIASKYNKSLSIVSASELQNIESSIYYHPDSIIVVEDIDTNSITHCRKDKDNNNITILDAMSVVSLSDVLNALDGLLNHHGRIIIITTNHIDKLDKALLRPGRFDFCVELGLVNEEVFTKFIKHYFPNNELKQNFEISKKVSMAFLQNEILQGYDFDYFIENYTK